MIIIICLGPIGPSSFIAYYFCLQGRELIDFLQNKYLPTLQLAPQVIQVCHVLSVQKNWKVWQ